MHKILFYNKFNIFLYMFRALCAHHQEVKTVLYSIWYHHTETRVLYPSTCFEHSCAPHQEVKIVLYSILYLEHYCAHHQGVKIVLYSICYHHTCRWPSGAQSSLNLCTGRPPTGVTIPDIV